MTDTIALIGRAPSTRKYIADIAPDALIYTIAACNDLVDRIDACVEIHKPELLAHKNYSPELWAWLQEPHDFPILMHDAIPEVPASVRYPKEEALALVNIVRNGGRRNEYMASSFDWLMAYAILQNPRRIEVYGYDMSSDTEYIYQREGASGWLMFAAGRGIEVYIPDECALLKADMLYGYDGAQAVTGARIAELRVRALGWFDEAKEHLETLYQSLPRGDVIDVEDERAALFRAASDARDAYFIRSGVLQSLDELRDRFSLDDIVTRQQLELQKRMAGLEMQRRMSFLNFWEGVISDRKQRLDDNSTDPHNAAIFLQELHDAHKKQNSSRDEFFTWKGGTLLLDQLIRECDLRFNPDWVPVAEIATIPVEVSEPNAT